MSNNIPTNALNPKSSFKTWGIFTLWVAELMARSQWEGGTRPTNADDRLESQPVILWRRRRLFQSIESVLKTWRVQKDFVSFIRVTLFVSNHDCSTFVWWNKVRFKFACGQNARACGPSFCPSFLSLRKLTQKQIGGLMGSCVILC